MDHNFWDGKRPPGVADHFDQHRFDNLLQIIEHACTSHSDRPAFTGFGHTISYRELDTLSDQFCRYIQHETTLQAGDRIAIQMANILQYPVVLFGALRAGLVIVNTNPLYTSREMQHQFNDAGVKALVFMTNFGDKVAEVIPHTGIEYVIGTDLADLLPTGKRIVLNTMARYVKKMIPAFDLPNMIALRKVFKQGSKAAPAKAVQPQYEDLAILQYTGGTTGVAKGAMLSHGNLIANMLQLHTSLQQHGDDGKPLHKPGQEVLIAPLPLYHIYSFTMHMLTALFDGNHNILIANPRDTGLFIKAIRPWQPTAIIGLNTLFVSLMKHPQFKTLDFSKLKATTSGGTALVSDTARQWHQITQCEINEGYGLTECSPAVCADFYAPHNHPGTVGFPMPLTSLKVVDPEGQELALGEPGELCVKGPQVMQGYWQRPEATAEVIDDEGWFHTGDVAVIDDGGTVRIVDRLKDMVLVSGFNVYPNEIEDVILSHPKVEMAAAIGVDDEKTGEAVKLFIVPADDSLSQEEVMAHCREQLTAYKLPKHIVFRKDLPMTPVGKVLRKELRDESA